MPKPKLIYVRITGTGINERFCALEHDVVGYPAGTYHKFLMENGATVFFNDFGIRSVVVADADEKLN